MPQWLMCAAWLCFALPAFGETVLVGRFVWTDPRPAFGGISAIHLADNGRDFIAVSDRGYTTQGALIRSGAAITSVETGPLLQLKDLNGKPLDGRPADAEAIAVNPAGAVFIAFEGETRVRRYETLSGPASDVPSPRDFRGMQKNASLESLAIDKDGALYVIPERSGRQVRPFPVYRYHNSQWDVPFHITRKGPFLIVGADIGPDGLMYVLERDFIGIGFRTRVRRIALDGTKEETLLQSAVGVHDNLEGITVWDDGIGLRLTLISDDNFRRLQQTEIVEYRITD